MSGFKPISGARSTSSYEDEEDDEFSSYDAENARVRTRGFSSLDASAYEARRAKCRKMAFCAVLVGLLVVAGAGFIYMSRPDTDSKASSAYTPNYGSSEANSQDYYAVPPAAGVPPAPVVDILGLCDAEYTALHGNEKCQTNCKPATCCFSESSDNCRSLDGADVICNMYASCKDVLNQPETLGPPTVILPDNGGQYYTDDYNGNDALGDDQGEYAGGMDEYQLDDQDDMYGYGSEKGGSITQALGGGLENATDFGRPFEDMNVDSTLFLCGNVDKLSGEQFCGEGLFCTTDEDCDSEAFPFCLEGCGDEFEDSMMDMLDALETEAITSFCATFDKSGNVMSCNAASECSTDEDCYPGTYCSSQCGEMLYDEENAAIEEVLEEALYGYDDDQNDGDGDDGVDVDGSPVDAKAAAEDVELDEDDEDVDFDEDADEDVQLDEDADEDVQLDEDADVDEDVDVDVDVDEDVDPNEPTVETPSENTVETVAKASGSDESTPAPGGMPPVEGFEGDVPSSPSFCGRKQSDGSLECDVKTCSSDDDCPGKHICLSACGPDRQ